MNMIILALVVCLFIGIANERATATTSDEPLQKCIIICMVCITIFGGLMMDVGGGYRTNAGSVLYAGVLALQYIIMRRFGWEAGTRCVIGTFVSLAMLAALMAVFAEFVDHDPMGQAYRLVIEGARRITVASFVAFAVGQTLFVILYRKAQNAPMALGYVINIAIVQAVDSAIFFSIAFGFEGFGAGIMLSGYLVKVAIGLLMIPLLALATRPRMLNLP